MDSECRTICEKESKYLKLDPEKRTFNRLMMQNVVLGCTCLINDCLKRMALSYKNIDNIMMHDWWCGLVAARYGKLSYVEESTMLYRQHETNTMGAHKYLSIENISEKASNPRKIKTALKDSMVQAGEFAAAFGEAQNQLAFDYSNLDRKGKIRRILFYLRNGVIKCGILRNIALMIYG